MADASPSPFDSEPDLLPVTAPSSDSSGDEPGRLVEAAVAAELATGEREATRAEAQAHIAVRLLRMGFGAALCLGGLAMLVLPGPGLVVLAVGLAILARDVAWAERTLAVVRRRLPADATGKLPRSFVVSTVVVTALALAGSVWWTFFR